MDLLEREELTVDNAAYTAEGALAVAMAESPELFWGQIVLVVGYGHIGRILARYLSGFGSACYGNGTTSRALLLDQARGLYPLAHCKSR